MLVSELETELTGSDSWIARSPVVDDGVDTSAVDDDETDTPRSSALHDKATNAITARATPDIERVQKMPTMAQTVAVRPGGLLLRLLRAAAGLLPACWLQR